MIDAAGDARRFSYRKEKTDVNALIVNCSPVRTGATAEIVRQIAEALKEAYAVRTVCVDDYQISFCRGCRSCHETGECVRRDGAQELMEDFEWADKIVLAAPSYWADVPGQFKVFIDRCTPWSNTHEPRARLSPGKEGFAVALRTGPGMAECEKIQETIRHFLGHLDIPCRGRLGLTRVENRADAAARREEILAFAREI